MFFPSLNGADLSDCRRYRYRLWRSWNTALPTLAFCGVNPSKADERTDDATVRWLLGYARLLGYGQLVMVNLFAWRATNPQELAKVSFPVQPFRTSDNDDAILYTAKRDCGLFLCGWGNHGRLMERDRCVLAMLKKHGIQPYAIKKNQDGSPAHPLRNPHTLRPQLYA